MLSFKHSGCGSDDNVAANKLSHICLIPAIFKLLGNNFAVRSSIGSAALFMGSAPEVLDGGGGSIASGSSVNCMDLFLSAWTRISAGDMMVQLN